MELRGLRGTCPSFPGLRRPSPRAPLNPGVTFPGRVCVWGVTREETPRGGLVGRRLWVGVGGIRPELGPVGQLYPFQASGSCRAGSKGGQRAAPRPPAESRGPGKHLPPRTHRRAHAQVGGGADRQRLCLGLVTVFNLLQFYLPGLVPRPHHLTPPVLLALYVAVVLM